MKATAILHSVEAPPNRSRPLVMAPIRVFREPEAAAYVGFSAEHLRRLRYGDVERLRRGEFPEGPKWVEIKRGLRKGVRYLREDLDSWIDSWRVDNAVGWPEAG